MWWYSSLSPLVWKTGKEAGYVTANAPYYSAGSWTKYNLHSTLETMDDAAYANWGSNWRMATSTQWLELRDSCTWTWTTVNGVNGYTVTGPNSNSIFLLAAGHWEGTNLVSFGEGCNYHTVSQGNFNNDPQYILFFGRGSSGGGNAWDTGRYFGMSIRPVRND